MTVVENNCQVKFGVWPDSGNTVTNQGLASSNCNGTEITNQYAIWGSWTGQKFTVSSDTVIVPANAAINNLNAITLEYLFKYDSSTVSSAYFFGKGPDFWIKYEKTSGKLTLHRKSGGHFPFMQTDYDEWTCNIGVMANLSWYELQIAWGAMGSTPLVKINNALVSMSMVHLGTNMFLLSWADDSSFPAKIMNNNTQSGTVRGTLTMFRCHSTNLTSANMTTNYTDDWGRVQQATAWSEPARGASNGSPNSTATANDPTVALLANTWGEIRVPDVGATVYLPTNAVAPNAFSRGGNATLSMYAPTVVSARFPDVPSIQNITLTSTVSGNFIFTPTEGDND